MSTFAEGYKASQSHKERGVFVPLAYIDICDGSLHDAILLSQIMYWHLPNKETGKSRMVVVQDGHLWIAKNHGDWHNETRLKKSTVRKCLEHLKELKLIYYELFGFAGKVVPHIRLNWDRFEELLKEKSKVDTPAISEHAPVTTGQGGVLPQDTPLLPEVKSNTETTHTINNKPVVEETKTTTTNETSVEKQTTHPQTEEIFGPAMMSHLTYKYNLDADWIERICDDVLNSKNVDNPVKLARWAMKLRLTSLKKPAIDSSEKWQDFIDDTAAPPEVPQIPQVVDRVVAPSNPPNTAKMDTPPDIARAWGITINQAKSQDWPVAIIKIMEDATFSQSGQGEYVLSFNSPAARDKLLRYERNIHNVVARALELKQDDITLHLQVYEARPDLTVLPKPDKKEAS